MSPDEKNTLIRLLRFSVLFPAIEIAAVWVLSIVPGRVAGFVEGIGTALCVPFWPASIALVDVGFAWRTAPLIILAIALNVVWWGVVAFAHIGLRRLRGHPHVIN
jgi:hypothetical protein